MRILGHTFDVIVIFPDVKGSLAIFAEEARSLVAQAGEV